jgi:hypothetical protein
MMEISRCMTIFLLLLQLMVSVVAFQSSSIYSTSRNRMRTISMRDGSTASTFFSVGDKVKIIKDVWHRPESLPSFNSIDLEGTVCEVWEKCEVDPHCCCAELAFDAPIQVRFFGNQYNSQEDNWTAHFAMDEIQVIKKVE